MIAGMAASLSGVVYMWNVYGKPDPSMMCNSMLAGLVAITSPCAFVTPLGAFIIARSPACSWSGACSSSSEWASTIQSAQSVCTVQTAWWGLIAVGLFSDGSYGAGWNGVGATKYMGQAGRGVTGLFYGDPSQLVAPCIESWNVHRLERHRWRLHLWVIGKAIGGNRVSAETEIGGLDVPEMGVPGYPEFVLQSEMNHPG